MTSPRALSTLLALALAAGLGWFLFGRSERRPNVLIVTLDTTRADRLSCYGYGLETTPNIDALAAEGARFEWTRSTAGITPMSHASILSGLNNYRHGMRVFYSEEVSHKMRPEVKSLPEILAEKGYSTAASVSAYPVSPVYGLDQGIAPEDFLLDIDLGELELEGQQQHETQWHVGERSTTQRRGDVTVRDAIAWLDAKGEGAPWFLWVHLFDVHDFSIVPPIEYAVPFGIEEYDESISPQNNRWRDLMYDPELAFMDEQVGRLFDWLREHDQYDDTIIAVTADHGQGLLEGLKNHEWPRHRLIYDWSIRVPLLMRVPGEAPGVVVEQAVRTIDIVPTILEALDIGQPLLDGQGLDGKSLLPLMRGQVEAEPRIAYADALNEIDGHSPGKNLPIRNRDNLFVACDGKWKLIYHELKPRNHELYNLEVDPQELENVFDKRPDVSERLIDYLEARQPWNYRPPTADQEGPNSSLMEGLGYTGKTPGEEDADPREESGR